MACTGTTSPFAVIVYEGYVVGCDTV
jgi:hypothetical protein